MNRDVLLAKIATIERCLTRIRSATHGEPSRVREIDVQDIVVLNLQRAVQAAIDLAAYLISENRWGLPDSLKRNFTILESQSVIDAALTHHLEAMVGFRNVAVHDYEALDADILESIVRDHLGDLEQFVDAIQRYRAAAGRD